MRSAPPERCTARRVGEPPRSLSYAAVPDRHAAAVVRTELR
ncbi:hypothetical protein N566_24135 [Streptomycetaceae bacterium MP113-05]|nr:hypothetical protein N566_24135 [Streptomycetaceae bacterium MP113-05]